MEKGKENEILILNKREKELNLWDNQLKEKEKNK